MRAMLFNLKMSFIMKWELQLQKDEEYVLKNINIKNRF